jgi:hypothetical protein
MIAARMVELIENHAPQLAADAVGDIITNERTRGFRVVPRHELDARVFEIFHHLGNWVGAANERTVQVEFETWGRRRFDQGIPLSEIVYAVILLKQHLSRYIRDHGLIESTFPRIEGDYVLPMHLHSLQELSAMVGAFFDRAIYHLARGYEEGAKRRGGQES